MEIEKVTRYNNATIFLLPLLELRKEVFELAIPYKGRASRLFNAYMMDIDVPKYQRGYITIVHYNHQDVGFKAFEDKLMNSDGFVDSYDIGDSSYGAKVYEIPGRSKESYGAFLRGQYSKYELVDAARCIASNYIGDDKLLTKVFMKDESLRRQKEELLGVELGDSELWSVYNADYDILTKEIKEYLKGTKLTPNTNFVNET